MRALYASRWFAIDPSFQARDEAVWIKPAAFLVALGLALFHLLVAYVPFVSDYTRNTVHFGGFVLLCALTFSSGLRHRWQHVTEAVFAVVVASSAVYLSVAEDAIYARGVKLSALDWFAGAAVVLGAIEYTRRVAGWVIPILILIALCYVSFLGNWIPGVFRFGGLSFESVMFRSLYGDDALFGTIASISATYVFLFIIFGAFLSQSGAGDFVINISRIVAGRVRGGPGIVAVIASGLTGTINGSAVANTASTGVITIPMMKRAGFSPQFAGAVEAAASTGGQLMPPIMGAGAFVMAAYTQIPYETIAIAALLPALLYFASVAIFVRLEAIKIGIPVGADPDAPSLAQAFKRGGIPFVVPIGLVVVLLISGYTPTYTAVAGIVAVVVASWITGHPMGLNSILNALALGARNMVLTAILLCAVGLMINVIATAGIGNTFSLMIMDWSGGHLLIAIVLVALASLVLGMGLPVTAAYIVLATLSAPALAGLISNQALIEVLAQGIDSSLMPVVMLAMPEYLPGMSVAELDALITKAPFETLSLLRDTLLAPEVLAASLLAGHMIVFWLSQDSNVTPPVCLAAFTGAAIAGSHPMRTGFTSWKVAKGLYVMPVLIAYTEILSGSWDQVLWIGACALVGIYALAAAMQGVLHEQISWMLRGVLGGLGLAALWPDLMVATVGAMVAVVVMGLVPRLSRQTAIS